MARHYVGFTTRGPTVFRNVRKAATGEILVHMDEEEVFDLELDFTGYLETSETVSSASIAAESVTATAAVATPKVTLSLSEATAYDLDGKITLDTTFSSSEKRRDVIRVRRYQRHQDEDFELNYT